MNNRTVARVAWSSCAFGISMWGLSLGLWVSNGFPPLPASDVASGTGGPLARLVYAFTFAQVSIVGALIASRHARNPIGWLLGVAPLLVGWPVLAVEFATYLGQHPGSSTAQDLELALAWIGSWSGMLSTTLIGPLLLLFPNGRLMSNRWRPVAWLVVGSGLVVAICSAFAPGPLRSTGVALNPFGIAGAGELLQNVRSVASITQGIGILLSAGSLIVRFRRARGDEQQQLKWITYGAVVWSLAIALTLTRQWNAVTQIVALVALNGFIAAVGLAMLKYRLYAIDLIINRTLVYGALALIITAVYVGLVAGVGQFVGTRGEPNLALSLLTTGVVAVAFQPLRERVHRMANRLVYGHRTSPYEVLAEFSRRISGALSADEVLPRMALAAAHGVGAQRSRVRVFLSGETERAVAWPPEAIADAFEHRLLVLHQGEPVGEIAITKPRGDPLTRAEQGLLENLVTQAGPAFSNVRLTEELRASRQRIVSAQDAERRRIERDLHDGAQQHLVALAVNARLARELVRSDPDGAEEVLEDVSSQASQALGSLRELARGVFPAALSDRGIAAALEADITRSHSTAHFDPDRESAAVRYSPEVEAAVYFCCVEALQNAAKHAPQAPTGVRLTRDGELLVFEVADTGPGFEMGVAARGGTGLQGMSDRLAAIGGTLIVRSTPGHGTTVTGRVAARPIRYPQ